jgi:hypothetical protein
MRRLYVPRGKATGCNPRHHPFATRCPAFAEKFHAIPVGDWPELLKVRRSLRPSVSVILDQGKVGSCAFESTTQALHISRATKGLPFILLNPWSGYCFTGGTRNGGSSIDDNLEHARDVGILPESVWPRSKGFSRRPPKSLLDEHASQFQIEEFWDINTVEEIGTALLLGFPVVFGWSGHSCVFTDLLDVDTAEYCNSWSADWGDNGFGKLTLRSVNFKYGCFALRTVTEANTDPTPPVPA